LYVAGWRLRHAKHRIDCRTEQGSNWDTRPSMADPLSTTISVLALSVSGITAWLTLFRSGTIKMT
jgi:hypothetical protein